MSTEKIKKETKKKQVAKVAVNLDRDKIKRLRKFSPAWVVANVKDAPGYNMKLIDRIRDGVKRSDWKQLINNIGYTEKELKHILPASLSSMQKRTIYDKETSERIYELARLYSLGYNVFDSKEHFKEWLKSPSKSLGGKIPFDFLDSSIGFQMVENEIIRIQYNVYS